LKNVRNDFYFISILACLEKEIVKVEGDMVRHLEVYGFSPKRMVSDQINSSLECGWLSFIQHSRNGINNELFGLSFEEEIKKSYSSIEGDDLLICDEMYHDLFIKRNINISFDGSLIRNKVSLLFNDEDCNGMLQEFSSNKILEDYIDDYFKYYNSISTSFNMTDILIEEVVVIDESEIDDGMNDSQYNNNNISSSFILTNNMLFEADTSKIDERMIETFFKNNGVEEPIIEKKETKSVSLDAACLSDVNSLPFLSEFDTCSSFCLFSDVKHVVTEYCDSSNNTSKLSSSLETIENEEIEENCDSSNNSSKLSSSLIALENKKGIEGKCDSSNNGSKLSSSIKALENKEEKEEKSILIDEDSESASTHTSNDVQNRNELLCLLREKSVLYNALDLSTRHCDIISIKKEVVLNNEESLLSTKSTTKIETIAEKETYEKKGESTILFIEGQVKSINIQNDNDVKKSYEDDCIRLGDDIISISTEYFDDDNSAIGRGNIFDRLCDLCVEKLCENDFVGADCHDEATVSQMKDYEQHNDIILNLTASDCTDSCNETFNEKSKTGAEQGHSNPTCLNDHLTLGEGMDGLFSFMFSLFKKK